jgi:hypothetical protein
MAATPHKTDITMLHRKLPDAQQLNLFSDGNVSRQTRAIAAASSLKREPSKREAIESHIVACGRYGATRNECSDALSIPINCVCGPILALIRSGRLVETNRTRLTPTGHPAAVLVARSVASQEATN